MLDHKVTPYLQQDAICQLTMDLDCQTAQTVRYRQKDKDSVHHYYKTLPTDNCEHSAQTNPAIVLLNRNLNGSLSFYRKATEKLTAQIDWMQSVQLMVQLLRMEPAEDLTLTDEISANMAVPLLVLA